MVHLLLQVVSQQLAAESLPHRGSAAPQQLRLHANPDHLADRLAPINQQGQCPGRHLREAQQGGDRAGHVGGMIAGTHHPQAFNVRGPRADVLQRRGVSLNGAQEIPGMTPGVEWPICECTRGLDNKFGSCTRHR